MTRAPEFTTARPDHPFDQELADEVCRRISEGQSLLKVCRDPAMPSRRSIYNWLEAETERGGTFPSQYARAREMLMDHLGDEMLEISDNPVEAVKRTIKSGPKVKVVRQGDDAEGEYDEADVSKHTSEEVVTDAVERSKLMVSTRQWIMERTAAKKWGRSDQLRLADANGENLPPPIPTVFRGVGPDDDEPEG